MWIYSKKLQYPISIKNKDLSMAKFIITQFGGPNFPPTFSCENCHSGSMYPINYKSPKGIVYKYDD